MLLNATLPVPSRDMTMKPNAADAFLDTPTPSAEWQRLGDAERLQRINAIVSSSPHAAQVNVLAARADGEIILCFNGPVAAHVRGGLLLDLEAQFKQHIDPALNVWLEPLGDKNSLRNLRGIEVKS